MISFSNGVQSEFFVASGALGFDGRGWAWEWPSRWLGVLDPREFSIVVKTLTLHPRKGNLRWHKPWGSVRLLPDGTVNAIGLTNPGIDWWIKRAYPRMKKLRYSIFVSVFPESLEEAEAFARLLKPLEIQGVEMNVSCPNTEHDLEKVEHVEAMASALRQSGHPLIVKLSVNQPYVQIAKSLEGVAEAVHAINSIPWTTVFPERPSPLASLGGGGVSGPLIKEWTRRAVSELSAECSLPIIAGGGVYSLQDMEELFERGASAFSFGTLFLRSPGQPNRLIRQWRETHPSVSSALETRLRDSQNVL